MKRHIPGLHSVRQAIDRRLEGFFLVRVDAASYRWHPQKPFLVLRFVVLAARILRHTFLLRAAVLQPTSALEAQLVPARLRL